MRSFFPIRRAGGVSLPVTGASFCTRCVHQGADAPRSPGLRHQGADAPRSPGLRHQGADAPRSPGSRFAFTLVEMLVVITIFSVLSALVIMFMPSVQERQRAAQGGTQVQGALLVAKQRALRDQAPRGIRLIPSAANPALVDEIQYIEQAPDYTPNPGALLSSTDGKTVNISGTDLQNGSPDPTLWSVLPGDYLEVFGGGQVQRITGVSGGTLQSNLPYPIALPGTSQWRILRTPRPTGEESIRLPEGVVIDLNTNVLYGNPIPQDILFSPQGTVISPGVRTPFLALWVRDINAGGSPFDGEPTIIGVNVRSGLVAAQDPDPNSGDPYFFLKDGRGSGK